MMTAKESDWLRGRRDYCEAAFSFLITEFGYRRSVRRFRWHGFEIGYLGPGAGVRVEWYPRDEVMVWLLLPDAGEVPVAGVTRIGRRASTWASWCASQAKSRGLAACPCMTRPTR
jgi:hypothetical protein